MDRFVSGEDVPLESLQRVWRDTSHGQAVPRNLVEMFQLVRENFAAYFPSTVFIIPPERRVPMQDQFDAVLYPGTTTTWTFQSK